MAHSLDRRLFLSRLGKSSLAVAVFGVAACAGDDGGQTAGAPTTTGGAPTTAGTSTTAGVTSTTTAPSTTSAPQTSQGPAEPQGIAGTWERVELGFVSAYVLAREGEALVVDTGVEGSADDIESVLAAVGVGWGDVGHVVLTHMHGDHIGSISEVMSRAAAATAYAGAADIPSIPSPRPVTAVADGDTVFGTEVVETPGHTAGHISVWDPSVGVLVAGDALNGADGGVVGANARFTANMEEADASVKKLAGLPGIERIYFGHGEPVLVGGGALLSELAASL